MWGEGASSEEHQRGKLLADKSNAKLILEMVKAPHYGMLGSRASYIQTLLSSYPSFGKCLNELGGDLSEDLVQAARAAIKRAIDTVVATSTLFKLKVEIPQKHEKKRLGLSESRAQQW